MKTLIVKPILLFVLSTILFSCKKDYVCSCTKTYTRSDGSTFSESDGLYTYNDTRTRASDRCLQQEGDGRDLYGEYTRDCELK